MKKLLLVFALVLGFLSPFLVPRVEAATSELTICPDDYYSFILDAQNEVIRMEYIADFMTTSTCQLMDILMLREELEKLKDAFRQAAFNCENTIEYKAQYIKLTLEIYFVRHLFNFKENIFQAGEEEAVETQTALLLEKLKKRMIEEFVYEDEMLSEALLEKYFEEWTEEYKDKITGYAFCEEGPWGELSESWQDFYATLLSIQDAVQEMKDNLPSDPLPSNLFQVEPADLDVTGEESLPQVAPLVHGLASFWEKFKQQSDAETTDPTTPADISGSPMDLDEALATLQNSELLYETEVAYQNRQDTYRILYGEAGAKISSQLDILVSDWLTVVKQANAVHLPQILGMLKEMKQKQCN